MLCPEILEFDMPNTDILSEESVNIFFRIKNSSKCQLKVFSRENQLHSTIVSEKNNDQLLEVWQSEFKYTIREKAILQLFAYNGILETVSDPIRINVEELEIVSFLTNKIIVPAGSAVSVSWDVKNAKKIFGSEI